MPLEPSLGTLFILTFAAFRAARLFVVDEGPWNIFERLRRRFPTFDLLHCIHCIGPYAAAVMLLLYMTPLYPLVLILAAAGGVSLIRDVVLR